MVKNYYSILGVSPTASVEEIKHAYRQLAYKYHPDANDNSKESEEKMADLNEAYDVLFHSEKRKEFDKEYFKNFSSFADKQKASKETVYYKDPRPNFYSSNFSDSRKFQGFKKSQETSGKQNTYQEHTSNTTNYRASNLSDVANFYNPEFLWSYLTGEKDIPHNDKYTLYFQTARNFGKLCANYSLATSQIGASVDSGYLDVYNGIVKTILMKLELGERNISLQKLKVFAKFIGPSRIDSESYQKLLNMVFDGAYVGRVCNEQILDDDIRKRIIGDFVRALNALQESLGIEVVKNAILQGEKQEQDYFYRDRKSVV